MAPLLALLLVASVVGKFNITLAAEEYTIYDVCHQKGDVGALTRATFLYKAPPGWKPAENKGMKSHKMCQT